MFQPDRNPLNANWRTAMSGGTRPTRSDELRMGRRDGSNLPIISISRGCLKMKVYTCAVQRQNEFRVIIPNDLATGRRQHVQTVRCGKAAEPLFHFAT